MSQKVKM